MNKNSTTRRDFLRLVGVGAAALAIPGLLRGKDEGRPNILFVIADDCTFRDIGCYGGQAYTPNIDKLATEGMRFTECFQAAPMCSPTRHNIYTGLYPVKSGAYPNHTFVKAGTKSVVDYLKPLGYRVALSGKKHIGPREVFEFEYSDKSENPDFEVIDKFIGECKESETPFCLFACSNEPHSPWNKGDASRYDADKLKLPPYFVDTDETRETMTRYLAEITYYDWQVGQALGLLEKHGVVDNTLVIVVSEQGSAFPFGKWTCYDTGLQSAFIARWPGKIKAGAVNNALIEYVDILPTFIETAGGSMPSVLDGKSLVPVLLGKAKEHKKYVFGEMTTRGINNGSEHFGIRSIRSRRFKYVWNFTPEIKFQNACSKSKIFKSWRAKAVNDLDAADKVRRYEHRPGEELYEITKDPYEWTNLADDPKYAKVKAELRKRLLAWMEAMGDEGQKTELEALEHQGGKKSKRFKKQIEKRKQK
ncbi:MAG: sulfatase-like hydrolase/transferase [Planctomycetota bacterium]